MIVVARNLERLTIFDCFSMSGVIQPVQDKSPLLFLQEWDRLHQNIHGMWAIAIWHFHNEVSEDFAVCVYRKAFERLSKLLQKYITWNIKWNVGRFSERFDWISLFSLFNWELTRFPISLDVHSMLRHALYSWEDWRDFSNIIERCDRTSLSTTINAVLIKKSIFFSRGGPALSSSDLHE